MPPVEWIPWELLQSATPWTMLAAVGYLFLRGHIVIGRHYQDQIDDKNFWRQDSMDKAVVIKDQATSLNTLTSAQELNIQVVKALQYQNSQDQGESQ